MVFTPAQRPLELSGPLSPLLLPADRPVPPSRTTTSGSQSSNSSRHPLRRSSTGSFSKLEEFRLDGPDTPETQGAAGYGEAGDVKKVDLSLDTHEWRLPVFKLKVLSILRQLMVPRWTSHSISPSSIHLQRVSGALTNAVFFLSFNPSPEPTTPSMSPLLTPTIPHSDPLRPTALSPDQYPQTLLLRIYGPSSDALISREEELRILHVLSSQYGLGPRVYGTFENGRVEQFFPSRALTIEEMRDVHVSRAIGRRMRELHSVDLTALGYTAGKLEEPMVWKSLYEWLDMAEGVLTSLKELGGQWQSWVEALATQNLRQEIEAYRKFVGDSHTVVFAHNDAQYGNLLKLDNPLPHRPAHHNYIVIDFEYAAPNPRGYDIANHFHEWRANYHHPTHSHSLDHHFPYPTLEQRENFYRAYLSVEMDALNGEEVINNRKDISSERVSRLEGEVRLWSPACSIFWALWGIIQAEEQVNALSKANGASEFDYLAYAKGRVDMFRKEVKELTPKTKAD